jgi:hypothetical protein
MPELDASTTSTNEETVPDDFRNERPLSTKRTPLPKLQLFIVYLIQFSEPVTATVIYPFINQLVHETGVTKGDERKTGYFAGIIVSSMLPVGSTSNRSTDRNLHSSLQKHSQSFNGAGRPITLGAGRFCCLDLSALHSPWSVSGFRVTSGRFSSLAAFKVSSMATSVSVTGAF